MTCKYFYQRVGNQFTVGIGERKIGELWFKVEGESEVPITQLEAEKILDKFIEYLNKEHPITDEMSEFYGDSDSRIEKMKLLDKMARGELSDEEETKLQMEMFLGMLASSCDDEE